jgi:hypothetical protein
MIGLGPRSGSISSSEAREHADRWGGGGGNPYPVHPSAVAYRKMVEHIAEDFANDAVRGRDQIRGRGRPFRGGRGCRGKGGRW